MAKSDQNQRAYERRKLRELAAKSSVRSYLDVTAENTRTHPNLKHLIRANRATRIDSVHDHLPHTEYVSPRVWIDTPEDRAAVAAILKGGAE